MQAMTQIPVNHLAGLTIDVLLKERMTGYIESADLVIYTYHASIKKIVSKILEFFDQR